MKPVVSVAEDKIKKEPLVKNIATKIAIGSIAMLGAMPAFADDGNLTSVVPTSFVGKWFWAAAGLVVGAVVAVKGVQVIIRFIRRI